MKSAADMSIEELAGWVCETLENAGITTTLTGGACVTIWSDGHYVSRDLDFVEEGPVPRCQIRNVLTGYHSRYRLRTPAPAIADRLRQGSPCGLLPLE